MSILKKGIMEDQRLLASAALFVNYMKIRKISTMF